MMWVNLAKRFLSAYAAKDVDELKKLVADGASIADICKESSEFDYHTGDFFRYYEKYSQSGLFSEKIQITLKKTAYNNKTVFIEFECEFYRNVAMEVWFDWDSQVSKKVYREGVLKFEIDMNKIQRLDFYKG